MCFRGGSYQFSVVYRISVVDSVRRSCVSRRGNVLPHSVTRPDYLLHLLLVLHFPGGLVPVSFASFVNFFV